MLIGDFPPTDPDICTQWTPDTHTQSTTDAHRASQRKNRTERCRHTQPERDRDRKKPIAHTKDTKQHMLLMVNYSKNNLKNHKSTGINFHL